MAGSRILYVSDGGALGHVSQDHAIASALRRTIPDVHISWLAADPAAIFLRDRNEELLDESVEWPGVTDILERVHADHGMNLAQWLLDCTDAWARTPAVLNRVLERHDFDLVIGGGTFGLSRAYRDDPRLKPAIPFVLIHVNVGLYAMTEYVEDRWLIDHINAVISADYGKPAPNFDLAILLCELDDVPDVPFGPGLPSRRAYARQKYRCVGPAIGFDPSEYQDRDALRHRLGYGDKPLILCSVGGSSIGRALLQLCADAYATVKRRLGPHRMVLVCGPRIEPTSIAAPDGVEARGFVSRLFEHHAASDLVICQGGGATTAELMALRRPFLYFPLEGHSEQTIEVARRAERRGAGRKLLLSTTTPDLLADAILETIDQTPTHAPHPPLRTDGADGAARAIAEMLPARV